MKVTVSTSLEDKVLLRIRAIAERQLTSVSSVLRLCTVKGLAAVEEELERSRANRANRDQDVQEMK